MKTLLLLPIMFLFLPLCSTAQPEPVRSLDVHSMVLHGTPDRNPTDSVPSFVPDTAASVQAMDTILVLLTYRLIYSDSVDRVYVLFGTGSGMGDVLTQEIPRGGTGDAPYLTYSDGNISLRNRTDAERSYRFNVADWKRVRYVGVYYKDMHGTNSAMAVTDSNQ